MGKEKEMLALVTIVDKSDSSPSCHNFENSQIQPLARDDMMPVKTDSVVQLTKSMNQNLAGSIMNLYRF